MQKQIKSTKSQSKPLGLSQAPLPPKLDEKKTEAQRLAEEIIRKNEIAEALEAEEAKRRRQEEAEKESHAPCIRCAECFDPDCRIAPIPCDQWRAPR